VPDGLPGQPSQARQNWTYSPKSDVAVAAQAGGKYFKANGKQERLGKHCERN